MAKMEKQYGSGAVAEHRAVAEEWTNHLMNKEPKALAADVAGAAERAVSEEPPRKSGDFDFAILRDARKQALDELNDELDRIIGAKAMESDEQEHNPEIDRIWRHIELINAHYDAMQSEKWAASHQDSLQFLESMEPFVEIIEDSALKTQLQEVMQEMQAVATELLQIEQEGADKSREFSKNIQSADNLQDARNEHNEEMVEYWKSSGRNDLLQQSFKLSEQMTSLLKQANEQIKSPEKSGQMNKKEAQFRSQQIHSAMGGVDRLHLAMQEGNDLVEYIRQKFTGSTEFPNLVQEIEESVAEQNRDREAEIEELLQYAELQYTGKVRDKDAAQDSPNDPRREMLGKEIQFHLTSIERMIGDKPLDALSQEKNKRYGNDSMVSIKEIQDEAMQTRRMAQEMRAVLHDDYTTEKRRQELCRAIGIFDTNNQANTKGMNALLDRLEKGQSIFPNEEEKKGFEEAANQVEQ